MNWKNSIWKNALFLLDIVSLYIDVHIMMLETPLKGVEHLQTKEFCLRAHFHAKWTILSTQIVGHLFNQKYKCLTILESLRGGLSDGPNRILMWPLILEKLASKGPTYRWCWTKKLSFDPFFFLGHWKIYSWGFQNGMALHGIASLTPSKVRKTIIWC